MQSNTIVIQINKPELFISTWTNLWNDWGCKSNLQNNTRSVDGNIYIKIENTQNDIYNVYEYTVVA